jgi:hypothetical protein
MGWRTSRVSAMVAGDRRTATTQSLSSANAAPAPIWPSCWTRLPQRAAAWMVSWSTRPNLAQELAMAARRRPDTNQRPHRLPMRPARLVCASRAAGKHHGARGCRIADGRGIKSMVPKRRRYADNRPGAAAWSRCWRATRVCGWRNMAAWYPMCGVHNGPILDCCCGHLLEGGGGDHQTVPYADGGKLALCDKAIQGHGRYAENAGSDLHAVETW